VPGTLLDTVAISPSTFGFTLIAAETNTSNPVNESRQRYQSGSNDQGPTYAIREVDVWDGRVTTGYRLTFDGQLQVLTNRFDFIPRNSGNISDMRVLGSGSDASQFITMIAALDLYDDVDDEDPGLFKSQELGIWATWNPGSEQLPTVPIFSETDPISEVGFVSNQRLVVETEDLTQDGNYNLQDIRIRDTGAVFLTNTVSLPTAEKILAVNTYTRAGLPPYLYTTGPLGDSVSLYKFDQNLMRLGPAVPLPSRIGSGNIYVRNPRDASLLIRDDDGKVVWIPSSINPLNLVIQGLGTAQLLSSTYEAIPLFVSSSEAVTWRNEGAPVDLSGGGVVPVADISHYAMNDSGSLIRTPLAPPILGRYVARSQSLSLDPETEGWFVSTFEKSSPRTAITRTYRLRTGSTSDRDGDGLLDIEEFARNTDQNNPDSDGDGIKDGQEIYPFYLASGSYTFEQARQEASRRGGRLAVLDTPATEGVDCVAPARRFGGF
jgi:hypothetical protein